MDFRRVAGLLAFLGGLLWFGQVTVLVVTDGEFPWARVEAVVYNLGMLLIAVAAGMVTVGPSSSLLGAAPSSLERPPSQFRARSSWPRYLCSRCRGSTGWRATLR